MGQTADTSGATIAIPSTTWLNQGSKGTNNDDTVLSLFPDGGGTEEDVGLLSFVVADVETLAIPSNAILRKIHIQFSRLTAGPSAGVGQMCFLNEDFTENQANWYGPDDSSNTTVLWEPAFDGASESTVNPGPLKGDPIGTYNISAPGTATIVITEDAVRKHNLTFGSTVNVGLWATSGSITVEDDSNAGSSGNVPKYFITYEIPTPSSPKISIAANPDGVTGTIRIDQDTDSEDLQKYSICVSTSDTAPDHGDSVTDFTDTGKTTFDTSTLTGSPLATDDTTYYFRLFAEDSVNTDDNGGASNVIAVTRPEVANSSAISPNAMDIGEETTLTVASETVSAAEFGGKFSSVLVNWDAGASDTDADYSEYFFNQATAPATTTSGNLTITHRYDTAGSKTIKVRVRDPNGFVSDKHSLATGAGVNEANPVSRLSTSRRKVLSSRFADLNNMLTISSAQSRAIGSDREIQNHLFTCVSGQADTLCTMGAFDNNNEVFDTSSKRVSLVQLDDGNMSSMRIKVFGLASFQSDGDAIKDDDATFSHYKYTSEEITPINGVDDAVVYKESTATTNFFKNIEAVVVTTKDTTDTTGARYVLVANKDDWTTKLSGVLTNEALDSSEMMINVDNTGAFKAGQVIKIDSEYMKIIRVDTNNARIYVIRGYFFSTAASHGNDSSISIVDSYIVNKELRYVSDTTAGSDAIRYRWGGFARVKGNTSGGKIDFAVHDGSGAGVGDTILLQSVASGSSSVNDTCWLNNGFFEDDIIAVGNTTDNGTYASPKYFKLAGFASSGSGNFDTAYVYGSDVDDFVTAGPVDESDEEADIIRVISNPNRTVGFTQGSSQDDIVSFESKVIDDDTTSFLVNADVSHTSVVVAQPNVLDLITNTDYDSNTTENTLTTNDIAITNLQKSRDGGIVGVMPLGSRKYPSNVTRNKMGLPTLSLSLRLISDAGLRKIRSLIEGDTYDYVFLDYRKIDGSTVDVTYRMKYVNGTLSKTPQLGSEYTADLRFIIVGEDVT